MTTPRSDPRHDPRPRRPDVVRTGHAHHRLLMVVCCVPMLVIAGVLVGTGVAGPGFVIAALACTAMMAAMMVLPPGGRS